MKKLLVLTAALVATAGGVVGVVGERHTAGAARSAGSSTAMTYQQALAAHDPQAEATQQLTAQEAASGLPMCTKSNQPGGYKSPADLQAAIAAAPEAPTCYTDPNDALFVPFGTCDITSFPSAADAAQIMNEQQKAGCPSGSSGRSASGQTAVHTDRRESIQSTSPEFCGYYLIGGTTYHLCFYHMGAETLNLSAWQGVEVACQVTTPTGVTFPDHVACTTAARYPASGTVAAWDEIGWWKGYIDTYNFSSPTVGVELLTDSSGHGYLVPYSVYSLQQGSYYEWRARDYWNGSTHEIIGSIFWNGSWQDLTATINSHGSCENGAGDGLCAAYEHVEVEADSSTCTSSSSCPGLGGSGITQSGTQVRYAEGQWATWSLSLVNTHTDPVESPYETCWYSYYDSFLAFRSTTC